jgi:hypothetical protein
MVQPVEVERRDALQCRLIAERPGQRVAAVKLPPLARLARVCGPPAMPRRRRSGAMFSNVHGSHDMSNAPPK